jgi:hypothetical protein
MVLIVAPHLSFSQDAFADRDHGTGSHVFPVFVAAFLGGLFTLKIRWQRAKSLCHRPLFERPQR